MHGQMIGTLVSSGKPFYAHAYDGQPPVPGDPRGGPFSLCYSWGLVWLDDVGGSFYAPPVVVVTGSNDPRCRRRFWDFDTIREIDRPLTIIGVRLVDHRGRFVRERLFQPREVQRCVPGESVAFFYNLSLTGHFAVKPKTATGRALMAAFTGE